MGEVVRKDTKEVYLGLEVDGWAIKRAYASVIEFVTLHWLADVVGIRYFLHIPAFWVRGIDIASEWDLSDLCM